MPKRGYIVFLLIVIIVQCAYASKDSTEVIVDFRKNRVQIDTAYMNNPKNISGFKSLLSKMANDSALSVESLLIRGYASPEGNYEINRYLASKRIDALEHFVTSQLSVPDSLIQKKDEAYIHWGYLEYLVSHSDLECKDEVLGIIRSDSSMVELGKGRTIDSRVQKLKKASRNKVWRELQYRFFPKMRIASLTLVYSKPDTVPFCVMPPIMPQIQSLPVSDFAKPVNVSVVHPEIVPHSVDRHLFVKTNAVGWAMLIANAAVEYEISPRWSVCLPVYYSGVNYFTRTCKFRTVAVQPEMRYWLARKWFVGAHIGFAYFNYALNGDWGYQDHNGNTPAYGGGVSAGWCTPISCNQRWWLELSCGVGAYKVHYDKFHNEQNGGLAATAKKTFIGIDNFAVTVAYRFNISKR